MMFSFSVKKAEEQNKRVAIRSSEFHASLNLYFEPVKVERKREEFGFSVFIPAEPEFGLLTPSLQFVFV